MCEIIFVNYQVKFILWKFINQFIFEFLFDILVRLTFLILKWFWFDLIIMNGKEEVAWGLWCLSVLSGLWLEIYNEKTRCNILYEPIIKSQRMKFSEKKIRFSRSFVFQNRVDLTENSETIRMFNFWIFSLLARCLIFWR